MAHRFYYTSIAQVRNTTGFESAAATDDFIQKSIIDASRRVNLFTSQVFQPTYQSFILDGGEVEIGDKNNNKILEVDKLQYRDELTSFDTFTNELEDLNPDRYVIADRALVYKSGLNGLGQRSRLSLRNNRREFPGGRAGINWDGWFGWLNRIYRPRIDVTLLTTISPGSDMVTVSIEDATKLKALDILTLEDETNIILGEVDKSTGELRFDSIVLGSAAVEDNVRCYGMMVPDIIEATALIATDIVNDKFSSTNVSIPSFEDRLVQESTEGYSYKLSELGGRNADNSGIITGANLAEQILKQYQAPLAIGWV